jgi:autotransporter-associated beta strand protein
MRNTSFAASVFRKSLVLKVAAIGTLFVLALFSQTAAGEDTVYLFSYFYDNGTDGYNGLDGLHLAYSLDGLSYHAVNGDAGIVQDTQSAPFMRDPSIIYGQDGLFHLTYTTAWYVTNFGYMDSPDLLTWNNKKQVNIMGSVPTTSQVWAPESFYDAANNQYIVYWSSEVTSQASGLRIYRATTTDYNTFSAPAVLYDPGFSTIDGTIVKDGANYFLIAKDERSGYKNLYQTQNASSPLGPYPTTSLYNVTTPAEPDAEGPTVTKVGDTWVAYYDKYTTGGICAEASTDGRATWNDFTSSVEFPTKGSGRTARHGTVFTVPRAKADFLIGNTPYTTIEIEFDGNAGTQDFGAAGNWLGGRVPGATQTAIIQNGHTVNLASSAPTAVAALRVGQTSAGVLNVSGSAALSVTGDVKLGDTHAAHGELHQSGGIINASNLYVGGLNNPNADGLFHLSGGTFNATGSVTVGNGAVQLDGGALYATSVIGSGPGALHFNGGTLKARSSTASFISGMSTVDVQSRGAVIDTNGYNVTIPQALTTASLSGGLTKNGSGILSLSAANTYSGPTTIAQGTLRLDATPAPTAAHRWSFNNSLADSIGGSNATVVDVGSRNVTLGATQATLTGGSRSTSDYINLGANLLPSTNTPVSIELWATQISTQNHGRIFDFGSADTENLFMSWTIGTTPTTDRVGWRDAVSVNSDNTNAPYTLGAEFHIVMVLQPVGDSSTVVTWYTAPSANANMGAAKGSFTIANTLANFVNSADNLGRSFYSSDATANDSYNEVRLWNGALSSNMLEILHDAGPDANLNSLNLASMGSLPSTTAVNITAAGATLDLNNLNQTIGSLSGVAGSSVLLGSGTLTIDGNTASTFSGTISGTGGLVVGNGAGATNLTAANVLVGTLAVAPGSTVTISPITGGPLDDYSAPKPAPEPGALLLLLLAAAACVAKRFILR